ncbi:MAG TPA: MBL fold metallo-hydrolase, partial [Micromonosporaceae bacterium]|jgi:glyoxylase-like metal-dependent hydrolase (beta-lactamase superfamily II)
VQAPDQLVRTATTLDLGGRTVNLTHPGRAHTAGDIVAYVPDADVLVAGDIVEEGNPPDFSDAYPLAWPEALRKVLAMTTAATVVVPGHGATVGTGFVAEQHDKLASLDWLIRHGHRDGATVDTVASRGPFPIETCRVAVVRGFDALTGE